MLWRISKPLSNSKFEFWTILKKMVISSFSLDALGGKGMGGGGWVDAPWSLLVTHKKVATTFNFQLNEPSLKFIQPPLVKKSYMPLGHSLWHLSLGSERLCSPGVFVIWSLKFFAQNSYIKILNRCIWGKRALGGGGLVLPTNHFWLLKRALEILVYSQMSPLFCTK